MHFYSGSGYLKSHNNLDLEIKLMLPHKPDFSGTTYVPTSSSIRRVNSCIRGTCNAWTEQLFIISMIRAYTDFHTYELEVLFKTWNIFVCVLIDLFFLFYLILYFYLFFWVFDWFKLTIFFCFRTQDERIFVLEIFVIYVINNIRTRFIMSFYVICAVIYCSFCCIYMWLDPSTYMIAWFMSFYKPGVTGSVGWNTLSS